MGDELWLGCGINCVSWYEYSKINSEMWSNGLISWGFGKPVCWRNYKL